MNLPRREQVYLPAVYLAANPLHALLVLGEAQAQLGFRDAAVGPAAFDVVFDQQAQGVCRPGAAADEGELAR